MASEKIVPVVRGGMVAQKRDDETFLIDANVFPGSSGSPVFYKPSPFKRTRVGNSEVITIAKKIRPPKLLGIVTAYIPYQDFAVSEQTRETRVMFAENSGLGEVLSIRFIRDVLNSTPFRSMLKNLRTQSH